MQLTDSLLADVRNAVARDLTEDIGNRDLTAELISSSASIDATIATRESMTLCGRPWVDEVLRQVDSDIDIDWQRDDGDSLSADTVICTISGPARSILTAERTALNFLQILSATATVTSAYVAAVDGTNCRILDTRKTIPGLRLAQKYAVSCGGGANHRFGLFDAILIKENHILSAGSITAVIRMARELHADMPIEIEVESLTELREALNAQVERLLLDNFSLRQLREAIAINHAEGRPPAALEASGGVTIDDVRAIAKTGIDHISVGALTKNIQAIDLSMRFSAIGEV